MHKMLSNRWKKVESPVFVLEIIFALHRAHEHKSLFVVIAVVDWQSTCMLSRLLTGPLYSVVKKYLKTMVSTKKIIWVIHTNNVLIKRWGITVHRGWQGVRKGHKPPSSLASTCPNPSYSGAPLAVAMQHWFARPSPLGKNPADDHVTVNSLFYLMCQAILQVTHYQDSRTPETVIIIIQHKLKLKNFLCSLGIMLQNWNWPMLKQS